MVSSQMGLTWPKSDFSRVPYTVFVDEDLFQAEQARIFRGPVWCYLGLEAELRNKGDYFLSYMGSAEVVVTRDLQGKISAFLNRCAHRGTTLVRHPRGNAERLTCIYHQWCYNLHGDLESVPFMRGLNGKGGMPRAFNKAEHGLSRVRVAIYRGVIFGTFSDETISLEDYLGKPMLSFLDTIFAKPVEVMGYLRQSMPSNWKLYWENINDNYHAGLLHQFQTTFGIWRNNQDGGAIMDDERKHTITFSVQGSASDEASKDAYAGIAAYDATLTLQDPSITDFRDEVGDGKAATFLAIFPNVMVQRISNTLATRQIRPRSVNEFELYWTYFGYEDDDAELRAMRRKQVNLVGPGGLISMEDGEAGVLVQRMLAMIRTGHSVIEMGGTGAIVNQDNLMTEVPIRGFWQKYHQLMNFKAAE